MSAKKDSPEPPLITGPFGDFEADSTIVEQVGGNASFNVKALVVHLNDLYSLKGRGFGNSISSKLVFTEVSIVPKVDEPKKLEARVVCELDVTDEMLNGAGKLHGGCSAFLVDICSTFPIAALDYATGGSGSGGVSSVINTVYHSPAELGDRLKIVCTSLALGARTTSGRAEIWNATHHRLVVSGVQTKMEPSQPKL